MNKITEKAIHECKELELQFISSQDHLQRRAGLAMQLARIELELQDQRIRMLEKVIHEWPGTAERRFICETCGIEITPDSMSQSVELMECSWISRRPTSLPPG